MAFDTKTFVKRILIGAALAIVAAYALDSVSVWLRARHATATDPYETLTAPRVFAISEKGNKTEYQIDAENPERVVTCVHSLFPHHGYSTCWQVNRTLHQTIPM